MSSSPGLNRFKWRTLMARLPRSVSMETSPLAPPPHSTAYKRQTAEDRNQHFTQEWGVQAEKSRCQMRTKSSCSGAGLEPTPPLISLSLTYEKRHTFNTLLLLHSKVDIRPHKFSPVLTRFCHGCQISSVRPEHERQETTTGLCSVT